MIRLNILIAAVLILAGNKVDAVDLEITVNRVFESGNCTAGELHVDGKFLVYVLERPWKNNTPYISSIPTGKYPALVRHDKTDLWPADSFEDRWRLELENVPKRDEIQIHIGNYPANTEGCLLVGTVLNSSACKLSFSKSAYNKLKKAFYGTDTPRQSPDKKVSIGINHFISSSDTTQFVYDGGRFISKGEYWVEENPNGSSKYEEVHRNLKHIKLKSAEDNTTIVWLPLGHDPLDKVVYKRQYNSKEKTPYRTVKRIH